MATISISTAAQKNEFLSRLSRIEAGTGSSKSTLYVGVDGTVMASTKDSAKLKKQAAAKKPQPLGVFAAILSIGFGIAAVGTALYLRFAATGETGLMNNSDLTMATNGSLAFAIALFGGFLLRMPLLKYVPVSVVGVMVGVVGFHNLVHVYPTQFANLFSPVWVEQVVAATPANSIIWRGQTFVL